MSLAELDQKFASLDDLPERLYAPVVTHPHGELLDRVSGIFQWREALLDGRLPDHHQLAWPETTLGLTILKRLEALDICRYCKAQEELTDRVLLDILEGIQTAEDYYKHKPGGFVDQLAQRQNIRDRESPFEDPDGLSDHLQPHSNDSVDSSETPPQETSTQSDAARFSTAQSTDQKDTGAETRVGQPAPSAPETQPPTATASPQPSTSSRVDSMSPSDANDTELGGDFFQAATARPDVTDPERSRIQQALLVDAFLESRWQALLEHWQELSEHFSELSALLGQGWDLTQGELSTESWRDIIRYRKLIKQAPQLQALAASLGRAIPTPGTNAAQRGFGDSSTRHVSAESSKVDDLKIPRVTMETGGIERSDEINRLLPSELVLLGHQKLKKLWHARRAERLLMTYRYSGHRAQTHQITESPNSQGQNKPQSQTDGRGPILVCLDTSGSMHGQPEHIAKALVLEALRVAFGEQRACYVYSFGGPGELLEHELDLTRGGLGALLQFLRSSFHGGTDVTVPLLRALNKQQTADWQKADILLISDGRFPLKQEDIQRIQKLKKQRDLRIHGLLMGNWKANAFRAICSPCHQFDDWGLIQNG